MKRFLIIFDIVFVLIDGFLLYYVYCVSPQITGDLGRVGYVAFGTEYQERIRSQFEPCDYHVIDTNVVPQADTVQVLTIGDSFSNTDFGYRYSDFLCCALGRDIVNIRTDYLPEKKFVQLVNNGHIAPNTIVIVECVERNSIKRLAELDFEDDADEPFESWGEETKDYLSDAINWIKVSLGIQRYSSAVRYTTSEDLFTHSTIHNTLYCYDSRMDDDGVLRFTSFNQEKYEEAIENLYRLHEFAEQHQIQMIYLIASDNYDVYEPFIVEKHEVNPFSSYIPQEDWIVNTQPILREAAKNGVKDIYYQNDSHWSPIGAKKAAEEIVIKVKDFQ